MSRKLIALLVAAAAVVLAGLWWLAAPEPEGPVVSGMHSGADTDAPKPAEDVVVPQLSPVALSGRKVFEANCAACHGVNAAGTDKGPPLIHNLYRPGHHGDAAFVAAVSNGVVAHHWRFGNMPPVPAGISETQMRWLIKYIREMQIANGVR